MRDQFFPIYSITVTWAECIGRYLILIQFNCWTNETHLPWEWRLYIIWGKKDNKFTVINVFYIIIWTNKQQKERYNGSMRSALDWTPVILSHKYLIQLIGQRRSWFPIKYGASQLSLKTMKLRLTPLAKESILKTPRYYVSRKVIWTWSKEQLPTRVVLNQENMLMIMMMLG